MCEYLPQQLSVDRVIRFLHIDEAHVQENFLLLFELCSRRTTNSMSTVDRPGREPQFSSEGIPPALQAGRDDFQQHLACMGNMQNPPVVAGTRAILLFGRALMVASFHCILPFSKH